MSKAHIPAELRRQVGALIADLPPEALNRRPTASVEGHAVNSLAVLAAHIAGAERFWIAEVVGGRPPICDRCETFSDRIPEEVQTL